jgi:hypothetical protein
VKPRIVSCSTREWMEEHSYDIRTARCRPHEQHLSPRTPSLLPQHKPEGRRGLSARRSSVVEGAGKNSKPASRAARLCWRGVSLARRRVSFSPRHSSVLCLPRVCARPRSIASAPT